MKKLGKLLLVLVLIVATFSSSLLVARAEPTDPITGEVDDSTIINGDDGGIGGSRDRSIRYYFPNGNMHDHKWTFTRFEWAVNDGVVKAYALYGCTAYSGVHCCAEVQAVVMPLEGQPGSYRASVTAERAPDGKERTEVMSTHHTTHDWIFDRFEWVKTDGVKAYALYHCRYNRNDKIEVEAAVTHDPDPNAAPLYIEYWAEISSAQSPDGRSHSNNLCKDDHHIHNWVFDGFEWDLTNFIWRENYSIKAYAVYHCSKGCAEKHYVQAKVGCVPEAEVIKCDAFVSSEESLDNWEYFDAYTIEGCSHLWIFDGFEWDTTDGVKATAVYHCAKGCGETHRIEASVTKLQGTVVPTYMATITAEQSADHKAHSGRKIVTPTPKPFPKPVIDDNPIVGPREWREIDPGKPIIVTPIFTPVTP